MVNAVTKKYWRIVSSSVEGASHKRSGKPNQDRIKFIIDNQGKLPIILSVADGHGGKAYFRSGTGASLAVETSLEVCKGLENVTWDEIKDKKIIDFICRDIVQKWLEKVNSDIQANPFSDEEKSLSKIKKEGSISKRPRGIINNDMISAYGSTLIITFLHETYVLYLQLGDGDILTVAEDGNVDKPLPEDNRLFGNETTSLCLPEAWSDFRFRLIPIDISNTAPSLIILSTDGYANSFLSEQEFEKVGIDLLENICVHPDGIQEGIDTIEDNLEGWLNVASQKGSGDDTTVGIICNMVQIKKYRDENYEITIKKKEKITEDIPIIEEPLLPIIQIQESSEPEKQEGNPSPALSENITDPKTDNVSTDNL
jgi:serine/threonine protein phosphatase PrpC